MPYETSMRSDRADLRRQSALDAPDAATDVEHGRIRSQQTPFGQTAHDLAGRAVQNIGGAEGIERNRGFRRDSYCPVELAADCGNPIAVPGGDAHQPVVTESRDLREVIDARRGKPAEDRPALPAPAPRR